MLVNGETELIVEIVCLVVGFVVGCLVKKLNQ